MVTEIIIMVIAVILALGMIGEKDKENKKSEAQLRLFVILARAVII